jgi:hypothetical protein
MSTSARLLIVIGGVLVLLAFSAFVAYPLFLNNDPEPAAQTPVVTDPSQLNPLPTDGLPVQQNTPVPVTPAQPAVNTEPSQRAEAERLSRLFIERFSSYSNYSNFENITSLDAFMTNSMRVYAQSLMKAQNQNQEAGSYYGVTTQLMSLRFEQFKLGESARLAFTVKQDTQNGLNAPLETVFKDGTIEMVYNEGTWLVKGLFYK